MATDPVTVQPPKHPLYALTTSELSDHRRQLEKRHRVLRRDGPRTAGTRRAAGQAR